MANTKKSTKKTVSNKVIAAIIAGVVALGLAISLVILAINGNSLPQVTIDYSGQKQSAKIVVNGQEQDVTDQVDTVESVDSPVKNDEDAGRGWYVDISTPTTFKDAIIGQCVDTDGSFGSQCYDTANLFWQNYTGRNLSTCGTGAAKGTLNCYSYNAGSEFDMIWDATQLRPGDIVVFNNGQWGHIGMAMGYYNNGYITLLSTNQGGTPCSGGGSTANIINISLSSFAGAFRPKTYNSLYEVKEEAKPAVTTTDNSKVTYTYVKGDYFSKVLVKLGYSENKLWGKSGSVAYYTKQLIEQGVLDSRGNVKIGVPFTLTRR